MGTLLLTCQRGAPVFEARRYGVTTRLRAHARGCVLDRALARGVDPDSRPLLSVRAHALIGMRHRRRLAQELRRILTVAGHTPHRFDPALPVPRHVLLARDLIEQIADALAAPEPVEVRGVAGLEVLLRDGGGPLYATDGAASLRNLLENVSVALDALPEVTAS